MLTNVNVKSNQEPTVGKMIGEQRTGRNENNNKNPFVLLSRNDFEVADTFLQRYVNKQNQNVRSVPKERAATVSTVKMKYPSNSPAKEKEPISQEKKQCLLCRTPSPADERFDVITESRFNLYKKLVQTLDFNHGLPHVKFIDEKLQFCCRDCYQAVHQLWELQQALEQIKLEMSKIVESMKAIEIKRPIVLKNKSSIFLRRVRDKYLSSVRSETSAAVSEDTVQIHPTQTDLAHLVTESVSENESVLEAEDNTRKSSGLHSKEALSVPDNHEEVMDMKMEPIYIDVDDDDLDSVLTNDKSEHEISPERNLKRPIRNSKLRAQWFLKKLANDDRDLVESDALKSTRTTSLKNTSAVDSYKEDAEFKRIHEDKDNDEYRPELSDNSIESDQESMSSENTQASSSEDVKISSNPSVSRNNSSIEIEPTQNGQKLSEKRIEEVGKRSKPHKCSHCKLAFSSSYEKMRHVRNKHKKRPFETTRRNQPYYCDRCKTSFYSSKSLKSHTERVHQKLKTHKCPTCKFAFYSVYDMKRHIRFVHQKIKRPIRPKTSHLCDHCGAAYLNLISLTQHIQRVHENLKPEKPHQCDKCGLAFPNLTKLNVHTQQVHEKLKPHHCEHCEFRFFAAKDLNRHVRSVHLGEKPYECRKCGKHFTTKGSQLQHQKIVCGTDEEEKKKKNEKQRQRWWAAKEKGKKCPKCKLYFLAEFRLKSHIKRLHGGDDSPVVKSTFSCDQCKKEFKFERGLIRHIERLHENKNINIKSHKCPTCELAFYTVGYLKRHIQTVHEKIKIRTIKPKPILQKSHQCDQCGAAYYNSTKLRYHIQQVHERLTPYHCEHCESRFFREPDLRRHVQTVHLGVKRFQCSKCLKRFTSVTSKDQHEKIICGGDKEAKLKRYEKQLEFINAQKTRGQKCPKCKKRFLSELKLAWHIRKAHGENEEIGSEDRKVLCELCGASFKSKSCLHSHKERMHLLIRRHHCYFCEKRFYLKFEIFQHMSKHTKERSRVSTAKRTLSKFKCEICWLSFKNNEALKDHIRSHDKILGKPSKDNLVEENNADAVKQLEIYNTDGTDVVCSRSECGIEVDTEEQHEATWKIQENVVNCSDGIIDVGTPSKVEWLSVPHIGMEVEIVELKQTGNTGIMDLL